MPPRREFVTIVVWKVWAGPGGDHAGEYDRTAPYDDLEEALRDAREALDSGDNVLIETLTMKASEYDPAGYLRVRLMPNIRHL